MKIHGEILVLDIDSNSYTKLMAKHYISISDHHAERLSGLSSEAQVTDETGLHKIVRTPTVDQNNHGLICDPTHHSKGLWG